MSTKFRQFGIEIECYHPDHDSGTSRRRILDAMRRMGYRCVSQHSHSADDYSQWQIKPDSSLSPAGRAIELVGPTLPGTLASIEQVQKVMEWLSSDGFDINTSCGYHIHIDAADMTIAEAAAIALRYEKQRDKFHAILPRSRHDNTYCKRLPSNEKEKLERAFIDNATYFSHSDRYVPVNLQHINNDRSEKRIEFRQHSGTTNAGKVIGWYRLLCDFIETTLRELRQPVTPTPPATATAIPVRPVTVAPIVRRQQTNRGETRSFVAAVLPPTVPTIEAGTDYDKFLTKIIANGRVTQADAREFGWDPTRLRVTCHWLRQQGAALVTSEYNGELAYYPQDRNARTLRAIFTLPARVRQRVSVQNTRPVEAPAPRPMPTPAPVTFGNRRSLLDKVVNIDLLQGLSPESLAWYRQRREDIAGA